MEIGTKTEHAYPALPEPAYESTQCDSTMRYTKLRSYSEGQMLEYAAHAAASAINDTNAKIAKLDAEVQRLTTALLKANEQAERFEREWYLRGDEIEKLKAESPNTQAREAK